MTIKIISNLAGFLFLVMMLFSCQKDNKTKPINPSVQLVDEQKSQLLFDSTRLVSKAKEAKLYCQKHKLNTDFCLLADYSIHSGLYRLFVWDFKQNKVVERSLVSHGCGLNSWGASDSKSSVKFSNVEDSHLASLGKYKIGARGWSNWGIHVNYKLHGLEHTNSNAYKRYIVLHSWEVVADQEVSPEGTPEGWGCPAVSDDMMRYLDSKLKGVPSTLFWIYVK